MTFNWADWIIVSIVLVSCLIGIKRGLIKEGLSVATWIIALFVALTYRDEVSVLLSDYLANEPARHTVSFIALFAITLLTGTIINFCVGLLVKGTGLSLLDRSLGFFFGLARGGVVVLAVLISVSKIDNHERNQWWHGSQLIPPLMEFETWATKTGQQSVAWITQFLNVS